MARSKLTITLDEGIIRNIDNTIDGTKIRNRSHAIEYLLANSLNPKISQALILAGGRGVEMRPFTDEIPKALIPVKGRPVIEYTIELLREARIRDVIIAIGHLGDKIVQELGDGRKFGVKITYSRERGHAGSAHAVKDASRFLLNQPYLVINGDILVEINLEEFVQSHQKEKYLASMALYSAKETKGYGTVSLQGEKILQFFVDGSKNASQLIDAGIYIFNQEMNQYIANSKTKNLDDVFYRLAKDNKLAGYFFEGRWFEISTPKNYARALKEWNRYNK